MSQELSFLLSWAKSVCVVYFCASFHCHFLRMVPRESSYMFTLEIRLRSVLLLLVSRVLKRVNLWGSI